MADTTKSWTELNEELERLQQRAVALESQMQQRREAQLARLRRQMVELENQVLESGQPEEGPVAMEEGADGKQAHSRRPLRNLNGLSSPEIEDLVAELQAYQAELARQNETLRATQLTIKRVRDQYIHLYDFAPVGYVTLDGEHRIQQANLTIAGMLGTGREALYQRGLFHFVAPEDQETYHLSMEKLFRTGEMQSFEVALHNGGETPLYVQMDCATASGSDAQAGDGPRRFYVTISNVTRRRQTEQALRDSEEKFRGVIEQSSDGVILADDQGVVVAWNRAQAQMTGLEPADTIGRPIWEALYRMAPEERRSPALYGYLETTVIEASKTGRAAWLNHLTERESQHPDGTRRTLQSIMFPIKTSQGFAIGGIARDVTDLKRTENALRESEQRFRQIAEHIRDVFWMLDPEKEQFLYVSPHYEEMFGVPLETLYENPRLHHFDLIHPEDRERVTARMRNEILEAFDEELRIIRPDGQTRWIRGRAFPIRDGQGQVYRMAGVSEDITDRKRAEAERERLIQELQAALAQVKQLKSLLPICSSCKKIRDDDGYWQQVEVYIRDHAGVDFSHGLCPDCQLELYPPDQYPFLYEDEP